MPIRPQNGDLDAVEEGRRTITREQRDALARWVKVEPEKLAYRRNTAAPINAPLEMADFREIMPKKPKM